MLRPAGAAPACLVVPVRTRTKKKFYVPEWARELSPEEKERRIKSMWGVLPEERVERSFYLASTGGEARLGSPCGKTAAATAGSDGPERCEDAQSVSATP